MMPEGVQVKDEPTDEFEDALKTLACAALACDSGSPVAAIAAESPWESAMSPQPDRVPWIKEPRQLPFAAYPPPAVEERPRAAQPCARWNGTAVPRGLAEPPVPEARWFDVGVFRQNRCSVAEYHHSERTIDHSADTSDELPDYSRLHKRSLLPGVAYKFRVAAINACGVGEWSDVSAFKTCMPGYPGAPGNIRISKQCDGATISWDPPILRYGKIVEYSVCLAIKKGEATEPGCVPLQDLPFVRVYCGTENCAFVDSNSLKSAYIERRNTPAIIYRIAARNEKGYGPATQVRWLQDGHRTGRA